MSRAVKRFKIHGAFSRRVDARQKARQRGGFVLRRNIRHQRRFIVLTKK